MGATQSIYIISSASTNIISSTNAKVPNRSDHSLFKFVNVNSGAEMYYVKQVVRARPIRLSTVRQNT